MRLAVEAMATRFELVLDGPRGAGEEALAEIVRLESRLSLYQPSSDVSWINAHAGHRPVKVESALFALLRRAIALSEATDGAFDITVGPLMRAWSFEGDTGRLPLPELVAGARTRVGYRKLRLDPSASTICFDVPGMRIDLGSIGKGYAIDAAIAVLRSHGVTNALLHGGTSSVHAIGNGLDGAPWRIAWDQPGGQARVFELHDRALSVSAVHGKAFLSGGRQYGHVIDPRTGAPTHAAVSAIVTGPASVDCDALSTGLLVHGPDWAPVLESRFPLCQAAAAAALDERLTTV